MSLYPPDLEDTDADDVTYLDEPPPGRARVLVGAALGPLVVGYLSVAAVLALVVAAATRSHFSTLGVLTAAMPAWLGAFQVPLTLGGHHLGALPLLPTLGMVLLVGRTAANAADRMYAESTRDVIPVLVTVGVSHATLGVVFAGVTSTASVAPSLLVPGLLSIGSAALGLARRGYFRDVLGRFDVLVIRGLRAGLLGLVTLLGIGALLLVVGFGASFTTATALFTSGAPGLGNGLGMFLLSAAYLPNGVVGGVAFVTGPGIAIGEFSATPLHFSGGPLPAVPLLAALPESGAGWWPVLVLLPLGVGALVGWVLRDACEDPIARLRTVGGAAVVVSAGCVLLAIGAGGRLANGPFNPLTMHPWSLGLAVLLWIALPAATVAWWTGPRLELAPSRGLLADAIEAEATADESGEDSAEDVVDEEPEAVEDNVDEPAAEAAAEFAAGTAVEFAAGTAGGFAAELAAAAGPAAGDAVEFDVEPAAGTAAGLAARSGAEDLAADSGGDSGPDDGAGGDTNPHRSDPEATT